jgi:hypothetical protein
MMGCFGAFASSAVVAEVFDHGVKIRPDVLAADKFNGLVLSKVSR